MKKKESKHPESRERKKAHKKTHTDHKYGESRSFKDKVKTVMHEFKEGALHSGSKKGPKVKNRRQAIAIALSEARKHKK